MRFMLIVGLAVVGFCGEAQAWGDEGHKIVCEIAFRLAQPDTRAAVRKLIRSDTEFDTFSESCVFPDHPRKRASEHFINLPRNSSGLTSDDCPAADKCVLTAILNDSNILASKSEKPGDRLIALKFLGHWVGDIHQPLHVSFEDDRGGNIFTWTANVPATFTLPGTIAWFGTPLERTSATPQPIWSTQLPTK